MSGRLIAVVGPSGVGKDSLIAGIAKARPDLHLVRRVITRPAELGGEPFEGVTEDEFRLRSAAGAFCLAWQAHGLSYGIPADALRNVTAGRDAIANLSRAVLSQAAALFPCLLVMRVTALPETLAHRLAARGRETEEDIRLRLARPEPPMPEGLAVVHVRNDGTLAEAVTLALGALYPERV
jgi:ribose 1,5-bisphosphokinase